MRAFSRIARRGKLSQVSFSFSTQADPYFILGVDKTTPFQEIKIAFYKLANEFHPDKNDSKQAQQKFVIFKQAFESIKMEKGLMKPQNLYTSEDKESMRPNPEKYSMDDAEAMKNFRDYTVQSQKAGQNEEFMRFNSSFKTINDINEIKIKVEEGEMPDPVKRFGLQSFRGRISSYSQSGNKYFFIIMTGMTVFTTMSNQIFNEKEIEVKEGALKRLTQVQKRKTVEVDLAQNRKIDLRNLEKTPEIQSIKHRELMEDIKAGRGANLLKDKVVNPQQVERV